MIWTLIASMMFWDSTARIIHHNTNDWMSGYANKEQKIEVNALTTFRMASVSKQFTAACIILLENQNKLNYSDPISTFFPDFPNGEKITIQHLLTHTSGLKDYESTLEDNRSNQISDKEILDILKKEKALNFEPGTQFKYSNTAYCLLTQIVVKISGMSYEDFITKHIFQALKLENTYLYNPNQPMPNRALGYHNGKLNDQTLTSATQGDGCVYTNLNDYKVWIQAILNHTLFDLSKEIAKVKVNIPQQTDLDYALGWFVKGKQIYHTGTTSGFSNVAWVDLKSKDNFFYFSNQAFDHEKAFEWQEKTSSTIDWRKAHELTD